MHLVQGVHGKRSFDYAREHGFLAPDVIAVHCYKIDDEEVEQLAESGAHLAHCPLMNQFRGGIAPVLALREPYRSTVLRRFWSEQTPQEIAAELGLSASTVRNRLARGLAELRERLERRREAADLNRVLWMLSLPVDGAASVGAAVTATAPSAPTGSGRCSSQTRAGMTARGARSST